MNAALWPQAASVHAGNIDLLFAGLFVVVTLLALPVFVLLIAFAVRYREGADVDRRNRPHRDMPLEVVWSVVPFALTMIFFVWAAKMYVDLHRPPPGAMEIAVVAKQWMWKFQHPSGQREINDLHVPAHQDIKLSMTSEDVIHSLYFPALRIKQDVLPGRTASLWFKAETPGTYHLLCAEFCGNSHSEMGGSIIVMAAADYAAWLASMPSDGSLAERGAEHYRSFGCSGCHEKSDVVRAPPLQGLYNSPVALASGEVRTADEAYIRDSILLPKKEVAAGYEPVMPSFKNRIEEEQLVELVAYIKSLATDKGNSR